MTKQTGGTETHDKDRKNRLKKEIQRQRKPKTGRIDERTRRNDGEARDRKNGLKKKNERQLTRKEAIMDKTARKKYRRYINREN